MGTARISREGKWTQIEIPSAAAEYDDPAAFFPKPEPRRCLQRSGELFSKYLQASQLIGPAWVTKTHLQLGVLKELPNRAVLPAGISVVVNESW
jgi:hypothetical protein